MKGLLIIVYTIISWYLSTVTFIIPLYLLSGIKPLRKTCLGLSKFIVGLNMSNSSYFYRRILNLPIYFYGDAISKNDTGLFFMNHRSSVDHLFFISLLSEIADPSKIKIVMKSMLRFFPGLGHVCYINDFPFLKRDYSTDQIYLKNVGKTLKDSNVLIFPEGTRFTNKKLIDSNLYSQKNGYPQYKNVLLPKTKGSYLIMKSMLENKTLDYVYDLTIDFEGIEKGKQYDVGTFIFKNNAKAIHIHCRKIHVSNIPLEENQFRRWMHNLYLSKDFLLNTPSNRWKNVYKPLKVNRKENKVIFYLILILTICLFYLLFQEKKFRYYHLAIFIIGTIIVSYNSKYKNLSKLKEAN